MKENLVLAIISASVGLLVGFLVWGATSAWSTEQVEPAIMTGNGMMSAAPNGSGMMGSGMIGGMMQGMMNSSDHEHMAQSKEMMGTMMGAMNEHSHANPSDEK